MNNGAPVLTTYSDAPEAPDTQRREVWRVRAGEQTPDHDLLAEETPIALSYNGISHATMLATPRDLEDFATGFSLTEGIIRAVADIRDIHVRPSARGIVVELDIASAAMDALKLRRRAMAGRTGCGLCGVETLDEVFREQHSVSATQRFSAGSIIAAMRAMRDRQRLHDETGATHAAGWMDAMGRLTLVREDVGRHNALDKLIGALARQGVDATQGAILVSSRASFEMVQKSVAIGVGLLAAISAPTALAARLADANRLTLLGFLRDDTFTLYTQTHRLAADK